MRRATNRMYRTNSSRRALHRLQRTNANATIGSSEGTISQIIIGCGARSPTVLFYTNRRLVSHGSRSLRRAIQRKNNESNLNIKNRDQNQYAITQRYKSIPTASASLEPVETSAEAVAASAIEAANVTPPTARQLTMYALRSAVPMIGFGFMDNTIMIHAGHYVDCTLGVTFSLSTLAAAGIGQIFSGIGGVVLGSTLDAAFRKISGSTQMTKVQRAMRASRVAGLAGGIVGVTIGCVLGLVNLLFVDEQRASLLKLQALEEGQEFEFEVEVDNEVHPGNTTVTVRGPDVDGVLASITASLASIGCSVVELHASPRRKEVDETRASSSSSSSEDSNAITSLFDQLVQSQSQTRMEDVFLIKDRSTHQAIENEDLDDLARTVLAAAKDPLNSHSLKAQVDELQMDNIALADRLSMLENMLEDRQIKVVPLVVKSADEERPEK